MSLSRCVPMLLFVLATSRAFAQLADVVDADGLRGMCHSVVGDMEISGGWADLSKGVFDNDASIVAKRQLDGKFWRLPIENGSWLPMPLGEIGGLKARSTGGALSELIIVDRGQDWMMLFRWFSAAPEGNIAVEKTVALFKAALTHIGKSFDCDSSDLAAVSQAMSEVVAMNFLDSGKAIVYPIGQSGAVSKTLERASSGTEWHALFYPSGNRREILTVTWIVGRHFPYDASDLPLTLISMEQIQPASEPEWAARFGQAFRTRDVNIMEELAKANGWRLAPPSKSNQSKE